MGRTLRQVVGGLLVLSVSFCLFNASPARAVSQITSPEEIDLRNSPPAVLSSLRTIMLENDRSYGRPMSYRVIAPEELVAQSADVDAISFIARDGFAASIPIARLRGADGARAWLAVESPGHPWPHLPGSAETAGPFYLVWAGPGAARVPREYWVYQVIALRGERSVEQRFPGIVPARDASATVRAGFAVFSRQCITCHQSGGTGDSDLGPDLTYPHSPTEYMVREFLIKFIREPQQVRACTRCRMHGFSEVDISPTELESLFAYLSWRAKMQDPAVRWPVQP